jgi:hypothetical protein
VDDAKAVDWHGGAGACAREGELEDDDQRRCGQTLEDLDHRSSAGDADQARRRMALRPA